MDKQNSKSDSFDKKPVFTKGSSTGLSTQMNFTSLIKESKEMQETSMISSNQANLLSPGRELKYQGYNINKYESPHIEVWAILKEFRLFSTHLNYYQIQIRNILHERKIQKVRTLFN